MDIHARACAAALHICVVPGSLSERHRRRRDALDLGTRESDELHRTDLGVTPDNGDRSLELLLFLVPLALIAAFVLRRAGRQRNG
jgi:hypothetical protein